MANLYTYVKNRYNAATSSPNRGQGQRDQEITGTDHKSIIVDKDEGPNYKPDGSSPLCRKAEQETIDQREVKRARKDERVGQDDGELQKLRSENTRLLLDMEALQKRFEEVHVQFRAKSTDQQADEKTVSGIPQSNLQISEGQNAMLQEKIHKMQTEHEGMSKQIRALEQSLQALRTQNGALKEDILNLRQAPQESSDEALGNAMNLLASTVQTWVAKNLKKVNICADLQGIVEHGWIHHKMALSPTASSLKALRVPLGQAIVGQEILRVFRAASLMPDNEHSLAGAKLTEFADLKHNNHEVDFSKQLRGMISKLLCKMPDPEFEQASEHYVRRRTTATIDRVRSIYDIDLPGAACESLQAIFREAVQISRMVRLQSATYGAHLPKVNARVNTLWMADRYGSTIEEATDAGVSMALFPALLKCSDRMGADITASVSSARVMYISEMAAT